MATITPFIVGLWRKSSAICLFCAAVCASLCGNACGSDPAQAQSNTRTYTASAPDGMAVFRKYCIACHGADGKLGLNGAKDLSASTLSKAERIQVITNGRKLMTPFNEVLSPEEIQAVAEYTLSLKK